MPQSKLPAILLATWFLSAIAGSSKTDELLRDLKDYQIVYPRVLSRQEARIRRSILEDPTGDHRQDHRESNEEEPEEPLFIEISNWTLRTTTNDRLLISSDIEVQWVGSRNEENEGNANCSLRQGELEGGENSLVVLTICDGDIYALMLVDRKSFFIQPLIDGQHVMYESKNTKFWTSRESEDFVSLMHAGFEESIVEEDARVKTENVSSIESTRIKRDCVDCYTQEFYNLSGDIFDGDYPQAETLLLFDDYEELEEDLEDSVTEGSPETSTENIEYFSDTRWKKNKSKKKPAKEFTSRWLELGIAADYSVVNFHGARVQQYVLALFNIVSAIYMDPSLESNMVLVIVRMIFYSDKRDGMVRKSDARRSLENVNRWNKQLLSVNNKTHDVAIWLTRLDIGGPSGYAPVSGVCDPARSCALNRDEGLTSAFIIAHEVAHILGLTHDGDESTGNVCSEEASRGSVMAPMVAATFHQFYWSACSKKEFRRRIKRWSCLLNQPNDNSSIHLKATIQGTFTMDEQCRMEFGEGYELCKSFDIAEPCSHLWCGNPSVSPSCKTKKGPPLDGTLCGKGKWCVNGYCEFTNSTKFSLDSVLRKSRNGGWSAWGSWGQCTRSCGIGVQCRSRKCDKPPPAYGGKYCVGSNHDCKLCEVPKCSAPMDLRAQQCAELVDILQFEEIKSRNVTWVPYESDQENLRCQLVCKSKETGEVFYTRKLLIDGTPCSYGTTDICIQGECREMGCDNVLGSSKAYDRCGVCGGDDSNCDGVSGKFQRKLRREITRVTVLPGTAHNAFLNITLVQGLHGNNLTIALGDGRRRRIAESNFASRREELLVMEGAAFRVKKFENGTYTMNTTGSAFDDVVVMVRIPKSALGQGLIVSISVQYSINRSDRDTRNRYVWLLGGWSFCSASCGGGTRQRTVLCKDEKTGKIVARRRCAFEMKPVQEIEKCNAFSCEFKWLPGPWEGCSASCGSHGVQTRQLYCVHSSFNGSEVSKHNELEVYRIMVRPSVCKSNSRPATERKCNEIPCPGRWIYTNWSLCSDIHSKGVQSRMLHCVPPDGETLFTCDGPSIKMELRPCDSQKTKDDEIPSSCWKDKSQFCSLPSLKRYCDIPGFRRKCCRSCETNGA